MDIRALIAQAVEEALRALDARPVHRAWLSPTEAAEYLGCTTQHLQNLRARRQGPAFVRFGRKIRYARADVDAYMLARKVVTNKP